MRNTVDQDSRAKSAAGAAELPEVMVSLWQRLATALKLADALSKTNLTIGQFVIMMHLFKNGPLSMSELSDLANISGPTTTGVITRLERGGLLTRGHDPEDRRKVIVDVTPAGARIVVDAMAKVRKRWGLLLNKLRPSEQEGLVALLEKLVDGE